MKSPNSKLPVEQDRAARRLPLSVFSLRPNSHTARPEEDEPTPVVPEPRARSSWGMVALGLAVGAAGIGVFWHLRGAEHRDASFTHIESTATGRAESQRTKTGNELRWKNREVVVAIDDSVDELGPGAREAVQSAFASWLDTGAELPRLRFESTRGKKPSERPDGINTVMFAPIDLEGHKKDVAITLTFSDPKSGEIVEADIVINAHHPFAVLGSPAKDPSKKHDSDDEDDDDSKDDGESNDQRRESSSEPSRAEGASARSCGPAATDGAECGKVYDLENAAAHEVGHFFGLGEDVEDTKTSMYQCISRCEIQKRTVEPGDRSAAVSLYVGAAAGDAQAEAAGCSGARIGGAPPAGSAPSALALALLGLGFAVRRPKR